MTPVHFSSAAGFRRWLDRHHVTTAELVVGFFTKASGRGGLTYPEALDEALCFGSIWSNVNVRHVARLKAAGRMHAAGRRAFAGRDTKKTGIYSFENRPQKFPAVLERVFRVNPPAWTFWQAQPPGYRRTAIWWVISAKQDETRQRRLAKLIALSGSGRRLM